MFEDTDAFLLYCSFPFYINSFDILVLLPGSGMNMKASW